MLMAKIRRELKRRKRRAPIAEADRSN